jgi:D-alanyl-D-alanine carboxypeptidase/D-alanyl-D-alanine-endopeptidase (penicillin-binding protein 4)
MRALRLLVSAVLMVSLTTMVVAVAAPDRSVKHSHNRHIAAIKHYAKKTSKPHLRAHQIVRKTPRKRTVEATGIEVPGQISGKDQLTYVLNRIIASSETGNANIGIYVKSLKTDEILFVRNIYQPLTPASIMKILTAEAALLYLGPDYRFSTQLLTDAKGIKNGVLQGNLYIVLSGDPSLVYPDLVDLVSNLQTQGITAISGNVYIDNTAYDQRFYGPGWSEKDKSHSYGAPISASIINHNVMVLLKSSSPLSGRKARTQISRRSVYQAGGVSNVVTDIPEYNRNLFKGLLRRLSIDVYGSVTFGSAPPSLSLLGTHNSDPLPNLVHVMLKRSDNVIAGALFKKLGQLYSNKPGSWENGSIAVSRILSERAGVKTSGLRLLDGSGLSVDNLATPDQFMQVLQFAYRNSKTSEYFISALPIAGVDGTLKNRMANISRKIRAKTGTISGVVTLAGYATTNNKEPLAFVIMINGNNGLHWRYKGLEDKVATALTRYVDIN